MRRKPGDGIQRNGLMILIYSEECPYCRNIARAINLVDWRNVVETVPIEHDDGRGLVERHHGEYIHSPHLFGPERIYYGLEPVAKGMARALPFILIGCQPTRMSTEEDSDCNDKEKSLFERIKDCMSGDKAGVDYR